MIQKCCVLRLFYWCVCSSRRNNRKGRIKNGLCRVCNLPKQVAATVRPAKAGHRDVDGAEADHNESHREQDGINICSRASASHNYRDNRRAGIKQSEILLCHCRLFPPFLLLKKNDLSWQTFICCLLTC